MTHTGPITEVALGVIVDRQAGRYLMGSRPAGKPYAGYWEFPGGKIEPEESVEQALRRELDEELGITMGLAQPWFVMEYAYPHAYVRLHYMRVWEYAGLVQPREAQSVQWFGLGQFDQTRPMLPMNALVAQRLTLPELIRRQDAANAPVVRSSSQAAHESLQSELFAVIDNALSFDEQMALLQARTQRAPLYVSATSPDQLELCQRAGAHGIYLKN